RASPRLLECILARLTEHCICLQSTRCSPPTADCLSLGCALAGPIGAITKEVLLKNEQLDLRSTRTKSAIKWLLGINTRTWIQMLAHCGFGSSSVWCGDARCRRSTSASTRQLVATDNVHNWPH